MRWFFILLPWIELFTLIQLGGQIGALATLLYVFLTLVLGLTIIRLTGIEIVSRLQAAERGQVVVGQMLGDDLAVGFAGLLLLIPGLITDTMAILVFIGPLRRRILRAFVPSGDPGAGDGFQQRSSKGPAETIDGEFRRLDD